MAWRYTDTRQGSPNEYLRGGTALVPEKLIQFRKDTYAALSGQILGEAEPAYITDRDQVVVGNGTSTVANLTPAREFSPGIGGTSNDYAAVANAYALASAANGVVRFNPGSTYTLPVQTADTPIITITGSVTTIAYGATIKVTCSVANALTTKLNEQDYGAVFKAIGQTDLNFFGGTFDGNRDDATQDPRYSFGMVVACERVTVRDMVFKNCQSDNGPFKYRDYDLVSGTIGKTKFFTFENNKVDQCSSGLRVSGAFEYTKILNNTFTNLDLAMYGTNLGPAIADPYGTVVTVRGISVAGFSSNLSYETAGPCIGLQISGNEILGSSWGVELYNGNNTNGDNPDAYRDVTVTNNRLWTTSGFNTNYQNNTVLSGNTWRGLTDVEYAAYGGRRYQYGGSDPTGEDYVIAATVAVAGTAGEFTCGTSDLSVGDLVSISGTLGGTGTITGYTDYTNYRVSAVDVDNAATSFTLTDPDGVAIVTTAGTLTGLTYKVVKVSYGIFLEGTPAYDMIVSDNVIDGGWRPNASNGSKAGIAIGWSTEVLSDVRPRGLLIANNVFHNLYLGLQINQVENATISGNHFYENRTNVSSTADSNTSRGVSADMTWRQNSFIGNTCITAESGDSTNTNLQGDWVISGNTFIGQASMASGQKLLNIKGFESTGTPSTASDIGNFVITGNTFKRFAYWAIGDSDLEGEEVHSVWVDGNFFDTEDATPNGLQTAYFVQRNTAVNKTIRFGRNGMQNMTTPIGIADEASGGLTETYDFGEWDYDSNRASAITDATGSTGFTNMPPIVGFGKHVKFGMLATTSGAATETLTGALPAYSIIHGVTVRNVGTISGASLGSYSVGAASGDTRWGSAIPLTASHKSDVGDWAPFTGSTTVDVADILDGDEATVAVTVTGARAGMICVPSFSATNLGDLSYSARVDGNDSCVINILNNTGAGVNLGSLTYTVTCYPSGPVEYRTGSSAGDVVLTGDAGQFDAGQVNITVSYTKLRGDETF